MWWACPSHSRLGAWRQALSPELVEILIKSHERYCLYEQLVCGFLMLRCLLTACQVVWIACQQFAYSLPCCCCNVSEMARRFTWGPCWMLGPIPPTSLSWHADAYYWSLLYFTAQFPYPWAGHTLELSWNRAGSGWLCLNAPSWLLPTHVLLDSSEVFFLWSVT